MIPEAGVSHGGDSPLPAASEGGDGLRRVSPLGALGRTFAWVGVFVLLLIPLGMVGARMPESWLQETTAVMMLLAGLGASWTMLRFVERRPFGALGFGVHRAAWGEWWTGFGIGGAMMLATVALLAAAGSVRWVADAGTMSEYVAALAGSFVFFAVAAAMEEVLFRGYAFQTVAEGVGPWPAALLFSALFGAIHAGNPNFAAFGFANILLAGVMLSVAYLRTRSLRFATSLHLAWNWVMSSVLDLPVSGIERDAPLLDAVERGADWWSGGAFGPEAGAAATLVLVAATAWMLRTRLLGESPETRALLPVVDRRLGPGWPR